MIKGEKTFLRLVCESDLDVLYKMTSDLSNRGDFFPMTLTETSVRVALKCGFQFDGTRKQVTYHYGKHIDLDEYFILRENWEKNK